MGELTIEQLVSVDGVVADPDGGMRFVEATTPAGDDLTDRSQIDFIEGVDAILLGRKTYEMFAGYWPTADPQREGVAPYINRLPKLVLSSTLDAAPWGDTAAEIVRPAPGGVAAVVGLIEERYAHVVVWGSLQLCDELLLTGLVDHVRLRTVPALAGQGRRFAPAGLDHTTLRHEQTVVVPSGHVTTSYAID